MRHTPLWNWYQRKTLIVVDVSVDWAAGRRCQTNFLMYKRQLRYIYFVRKVLRIRGLWLGVLHCSVQSSIMKSAIEIKSSLFLGLVLSCAQDWTWCDALCLFVRLLVCFCFLFLSPRSPPPLQPFSLSLSNCLGIRSMHNYFHDSCLRDILAKRMIDIS